MIVFYPQVPLDGCETSYNSDGNLENAIIIQENPSHISESDKKYLLTCVPIATTTFHSLSETVNFGGITVDSQAITVAAISGSGSADQHLQYQVELHKVNLNGTLQPINGPVYVGDEIAYIIRINSLATDARIGHCWARDAQSTLQLSDDNGCSVQLLGDVWNHFQRQQYGNSIIFRNRIKAWAFPTSNDVNIFCNLHMCHITCHHTPCNNGRQRRNVRMPNDVENNVIQIAEINFHVKNNDKTLQDEKRREMKREQFEVYNKTRFISRSSTLLHKNKYSHRII
uniref:ZP domain-containing protein n=1 Tax=Setaria digitata TaxID=48799 RepID=A0A915Q476_9BILA